MVYAQNVKVKIRENHMSLLKQTITPLQCRDTALALAFLSLLIWLFVGVPQWIYASMGILLLAMVWPSAMTWPARFWFGLSHILGAVMSKVLLGCIYLCVLMPIALVRRMLGKDPMAVRQWKASQGSAFVVREHTFVSDDVKHPY